MLAKPISWSPGLAVRDPDLLMAVPLWDPTAEARDLVSGELARNDTTFPPAGGTPQLRGSQVGHCLGGFTSGVDYYLPRPPRLTGSPFSMLLVCSATSTDGNSAGLALYEDGVSPFDLFAIYPLDNSGGNGVRVYWGDAFSIINENTGVVRYDGLPHVFVFVTRSSTDHEIYVDGVSRGTSSATTTLAANLDRVGIGNWGSQGFDLTNGLIHCVAIWSRALGEREVDDLSADPFRLFRRPRRFPRWWAGNVLQMSASAEDTDAPSADLTALARAVADVPDSDAPSADLTALARAVADVPDSDAPTSDLSALALPSAGVSDVDDLSSALSALALPSASAEDTDAPSADLTALARAVADVPDSDAPTSDLSALALPSAAVQDLDDVLSDLRGLVTISAAIDDLDLVTTTFAKQNIIGLMGLLEDPASLMGEPNEIIGLEGLGP